MTCSFSNSIFFISSTCLLFIIFARPRLIPTTSKCSALSIVMQSRRFQSTSFTEISFDFILSPRMDLFIADFRHSCIVISCEFFLHSCGFSRRQPKFILHIFKKLYLLVSELDCKIQRKCIVPAMLLTQKRF